MEEWFTEWVHLLPLGRTFSYADAGAAALAVKDDPTAVEVHTCNKRSGYLSFSLNYVPEVSYLDLHWPYDPASVPGRLCALPYLLSIDENLLLIRIDQYPSDTDLFVYTAGSLPSVQRLPACDKVIDGLAGRSKFLQMATDIGILRRGGDENDYVVADLAVSLKASVDMGFRKDSCCYDPEPMMAVLCTFAPKTCEWTVKEMRAPQPGGQDEFPILWTCDGVVPFAGRYLCWVDYYSGILIRDFSDEDSPCLSYVPFPDGGTKQYSDATRVERNCPESFRRVAVCQDMLHFIHIDDDYCQVAGGPCETITVWNLKMTDNHNNWDVLHMVRLSDIWSGSLWSSNELPHRRPEFPLMTKDDPNVLSCVLREAKHDGKAWLIMLDMESVTLQCCIPYTTEEIKDGGVARRADVLSTHVEQRLIPSRILHVGHMGLPLDSIR
ncbi:hypothetical protein QOZ80_1BG0086090 [Eleusine coracana subsp. coracana]|nr:hypothetical protein QOZ80_1BG0086090 [Eleusine coracana subsp. coracana]